MAEIVISDQDITEIVNRLVEGLHPERIYLFGSYARGTQIAGASDIDLLVVVPDSELPRHQREAHSYDLLWGTTRAVDLIVLTRNEFVTALQVKTSLPRAVEEKGKLIYAAG
jgi:predicted nucleotidyltransferase